ncbi:MAG: membrane protein insertase YidC [Endomicrobiales bacterium]|jgi:YidC/Oxa1 family membrane protein insertase
MQKNTFWAILLSSVFLIVWYAWVMPPQKPVPSPAASVSLPSNTQLTSPEPAGTQSTEAVGTTEAEKEVVVETNDYQAVFTSRGAGIKHWYLKEKNGTLADLVLPDASPCLATFPGSNYLVSQPSNNKIVFTHESPLGWKITKTFDLSDDYLHTLTIDTVKVKPSASLPVIELNWGPGLGTDVKQQKDNFTVTRAIGFPRTVPLKLERFKAGEYNSVASLQWAAIDNRYFLAAFIFDETSPFTTVSAYRENRHLPFGMVISSAKPGEAASQHFSMRMYLGPKGHAHLKSLNLNLEESVDFGFFGFIGKITLSVLLLFRGLTHNYGWAIILLTICIQMLVLPLTVKSFKASAHMKKLQPLFKQIQDKYKNDPKRLQAEMMNIYKVHKFNPMSGCLPMILQLPIFWALFTTLRNAFELRGAPWILWVHDLSVPETLITVAGFPIHLLPLIMGIGMFFQQKMMSATTDPTQAKIMYIMPVMFVFMFWGFPAGLVLYWLTNSIVTMIEQMIIMKQDTGGEIHG